MAFLASGEVVIFRKCFRNVSTPKFVSAEPKNTGESCPLSTSSWSNSAEVKATATGTKPAISVKSTKKGVATVSWKAVAGADGYDVYCGSSRKSQKGTVVKGTTKLTANRTKLTSGKTYYFRARAYKMVGSAKVYTGYSAVKSVKVK